MFRYPRFIQSEAKSNIGSLHLPTVFKNWTFEHLPMGYQIGLYVSQRHPTLQMPEGHSSLSLYKNIFLKILGHQKRDSLKKKQITLNICQIKTKKSQKKQNKQIQAAQRQKHQKNKPSYKKTHKTNKHIQINKNKTELKNTSIQTNQAKINKTKQKIKANQKLNTIAKQILNIKHEKIKAKQITRLQQNAIFISKTNTKENSNKQINQQNKQTNKILE
ncbi:hypothetical protein TTHERM_000735269 (macronuclear) [Tetrahymena thermophila SB210]|uniref:Uncharacterized protein n=1 Tax=Tetrahymena thermophila (strain SB210) TaxID=312017 RepID=W7XDH9_TETTS|nr:hypothetical protein TTHERM_000735269 [Tetrahymena thermophila SB210]EWS75622.1 hypothetical protein TTHERM_000735269 [Tetrahymena thermophila SB210]|eukprot:XP_012651841.1 hypothetical protein TTHERM_000735269 [Tetrahymena thermophila SB210]